MKKRMWFLLIIIMLAGVIGFFIPAGGSGVHWKALVPAAFVMASIPGANQLLSFRNGLRQGTAVAIYASGGRFTAFALMIGAVALGLSALLETSTLIFILLKWVGVLYLAWLGISTLVSSKKEYTDDEPASSPEKRSALGFAKQEFLVAAANPKALLLFTVFLPQFIEAGGHGTGGQIILAGAAYILIEALCATVYAFIGGKMRATGLSGKMKKRLDRITGGSLLGLALWLSTEEQK
ncbi:LysE family translocator [Halobacillus salinarum]|uniref:LysE family translocator n=1 Tax=Halobacillus salinarum TaxID=2932257 RepID=A0ABY4EMX4_9BACI|nr:LysE family translocator [Halobacillus salinarum]UOQ44957.1 LysE family translocator [Halobacillus salinarum]